MYEHVQPPPHSFDSLKHPLYGFVLKTTALDSSQCSQVHHIITNEQDLRWSFNCFFFFQINQVPTIFGLWVHRVNANSTHNLLAVRQVAPSRNWSFIKPRGCSFTLQQCSTCMLNSMETRRDGDRRPNFLFLNKTVQWNLFVWCTNKAQSTEHDELHKGSIKHGFRTEPHLKEFTWQ